MKKLNSKGQIDALQPLVITLIVVGIILVVGFLIVDAVGDQAISVEGAGEYGDNATISVQNTLDDIPGWLPIIIVVVIGALLIGLVSFLRNQVR